MYMKRTVVKCAVLAGLAVGAILPTELCAEPVKMRVGTYNIRCTTPKDQGERSWNDRRKDFFEHLRKLDLDVFGLQEVTVGQYKEIEKEFSDYAMVGRFREAKDFTGEAVPVCYKKSRFDLEKSGTFWLSETPDKPSKGWDAACVRTCTWTKLKMKSNGKVFAYLNTHLDHVGKVSQKEGLALIMKRAKEIVPDDMPIFLTADFNAVTSKPIFEPVKAEMKDAREVSPETDRRATINFYQPGNEDKAEWIIDHIFFRGAEPKTFKVLRDKDYGAPYISDHYPVAFEAEI